MTTLDATVQSIEEIEGGLAGFCEAHALPPKLAFSLELILEELVVNIAKHGYGGAEGPIHVRLWREGNRVAGSVSDRGEPFDPTAAPEPHTTLSIEERGIGGLGIHLVRTMVDGLSYQRAEGANQLTFTMAIPKTEDPETTA